MEGKGTQALLFSDEDVGEDFYETIEAPKFVDLTDSDPCRPDDRYWFCSRVGCDSNHPEEMDSEAQYKNFVMRVMAARSPNVRLHRTQRNMKCPLTAPPKSSKSKVSRLAVVSSFSKRMVQARAKLRLSPAKPSATPNVKPKQVSFKAMTTPRNRKPNSNPKAFMSVRNTRTTLAEVSKPRMVAKALVFQSPRKDAKKMTSIERDTPTSLCVAMKKLEITSAKKNFLGGGKPLPRDISRKTLRGREVKSRVFDTLGTNSCKSAKILKGSKEKILKRLPHEKVDNEADDMDLDDKPRHASMEGFSLSSDAKRSEGNQDEEPDLNGYINYHSKGSENDETLSSNSEKKNSGESDFTLDLHDVEDKKNQECIEEQIEINISERLESSSEENIAKSNEVQRSEEIDNVEVKALDKNRDDLFKSSEGDGTSISSFGEKYSDESCFTLVQYKVKGEKNQECNLEDDMKSGELEMKISKFNESDDKENVALVNEENAVACVIENDENENIADNETRGDHSCSQSKTVTIGKHENSTNTAKVKGVLKKKTSKENSTPASLGSNGLKSSRPKLTNPRPFRLRTDERGVLREANLEKKLNCPLKDITTSRKLCGDKLQSKNQYSNRKSEKYLNNCEYDNDAEENHEPKISEGKQGWTVPASSNTIKRDVGCKLSTRESQKCVASKRQKQNLLTCQVEPGKEKATKNIVDKLKRTKLEQKSVRKPQRGLSSKKEKNSLAPSVNFHARKEGNAIEEDIVLKGYKTVKLIV